MMKRYWVIWIIGIFTTLAILGWYIEDNAKIGILDYRANKDNYRIVAEEIGREPGLRIIYGKILVGEEAVCEIAELNCLEKYSKLIKAAKSAQIVKAVITKKLGVLEVRTENSKDTPFWSDWSERFYLYDPNGTITRRVLQDYGDGWKLSYNYVFDIEQR